MLIYLDNAATTFPKPGIVISEMTKCLSEYCANPGRSGHNMSMKMSSLIYETRERIAAFFNIQDPLRVVFTSNATEALNLGIRGLLSPGDHIITTAMEHNSVLRPLKEFRGIKVSIIPADNKGQISVSDITKAIMPNTRMIICTHSSNVTGTIMPIDQIGELCHKNRLLFFVDASQSAGVIPIDVQKYHIDILACPGHKSLFGPQGTGFLYVRPGLSLTPLKSGGTGTDSGNLSQPRYFPEGYESGTLNGPGIIGLNEGLKFIDSIGISTIHQWETHICSALYNELMNMKNVIVYGPDSSTVRTAIVSFNVLGKGCEASASELNSNYGIAVRAGYHCAPLAHKAIGTYDIGAIRISPGIFTTREDLKKTVDAIFHISA